ncbi:hypothetical protein CcrC1_gp237c [Caulobacter phage C1]|nr:hypothetical protein CcrC1_gp237c [Caulobacter phage C1]UTU08466.1 hypothetical protein CcrC2_gp238c [Caulobacter phage C2]UTU10099.1 hypothetical protein CcrRB23_gp237c [Caulobacter phage RB23]UXY92605.1 hypothetical protein CcrJ4_gp232c [Caulobacter phage J4]WGN97134.1 hypothetical protein [Bertelyvirus sp.]
MRTVRVFDAKGAFGTMEQAGEAFNAMLIRLAQNPDVLSIEAEVLTDGTHQNLLFGEQPSIIGYRIDATFAVAAVANDNK